MGLRILSITVVMFVGISKNLLYAQETSANPISTNAVVNQMVEPQPVPSVVNAEIPVAIPPVQPIPIESKSVVEETQNISPEVAVPLPTDHAFFNRIKGLAGRWEGSSVGSAKSAEDKIYVTYEITAGGNAVMERLFPGTNQEMVTMYYENKGRVYLTSYGILGNRPVMELLPTQGNILDFVLVPQPDIDPKVDTHLHTLKISFVDKNTMKQEWKMFEAGKEVGSYSFQLTRVASNP